MFLSVVVDVVVVCSSLRVCFLCLGSFNKLDKHMSSRWQWQIACCGKLGGLAEPRANWWQQCVGVQSFGKSLLYSHRPAMQCVCGAFLDSPT